MTVHSFHVFDRKGKTLFTKNYIQARSGPPVKLSAEEEETLSEQRKLIFGMLFSLREMCGNLSPAGNNDGQPSDVQMVKTGASCLYNFETISGLKFAVFTTPETSYGATSSSLSGMGTGSGLGGPGGSGNLSNNAQTSSSASLGAHAGGTGAAGSSMDLSQYSGMTSPNVNANIREALRHIYEKIWVAYVVRSPMYNATNPEISSTNFEAALDHYLKGMPWFR